MFFGLTIEKLALIGVIAALLIGPERLPRYAEALAQFVRRGREYLKGARERVRDEMGPDFDDVDWRKLDPRQYDPRRIIREALLDDAPVRAPHPMAAGAAAAASEDTAAASEGTAAAAGAAAAESTDAGGPARPATTPVRAGDTPPFDSEAT